MAGRLVVIPSDPIAAYERAGLDWLDRYYNPQGIFAEVFVLSPYETADREAHGLKIRRVPASRLRRAIEELRPDAVRAYGGHWPARLACASRVPGIPVLVSVHDSRAELIDRRIRRADLVLCVSGAVEKAVRAKGVEPARIRRLPNRVDLDVFRPVVEPAALAAVANRFPPGKHVLHVGRKSPEKNIETVIRALARLPEQYSAVFIGPGDPQPYQRLAGAEGVASRCFFIESVKNAQLPAWYSWCDCFCAPSLCEGFGIVFIEAAACGAAIVASDIAPMNEYLAHGKSAELVGDYRSPEAVARAIEKACADTGYRRCLAAGAIEAARPFARDRIDALEAAIYREATEMSPRPVVFAERLDRVTDAARRSMRCVSRTLPGAMRCVSRRQQACRPADVDPPPMRALQWIRDNHLAGSGIRVQSGHSKAYPEVTGYLIPTLLEYGETGLAADLTRWLLEIQRPDGSFPDPDQGQSYVFDTGQVLRGLLAAMKLVPEAEAAARRAADYLVGQMRDGGAGGFPKIYSGKWWLETAQLYVLPPLVQAAQVFGEPRYRHAAERCLEYYVGHPEFLRIGDLTHFLAYELEALVDLGRADLARPVLDRLRARQRRTGAVRGAGGRAWVCIPGLAQLAVCWYKLGQPEPADRALDWVERHQRPDGGFRGSSGLGASYKQDAEVSWGPKYYLDAHQLRVRAMFDRNAHEFPAEVSSQDGRLRAILECVRPGDRVLEVGCGKGRFLKEILAACPDADATGVDPSPVLASHLPPAVQFVPGRLESIPLADGRYDVVFSVEAIEHSANPRRAVAEMARVARPGGWLVIVDKQKSHWGRLECPSWEHWPDIDELKQLLERHCGQVSAHPVAYDDHPADGLMIAWKGEKRG